MLGPAVLERNVARRVEITHNFSVPGQVDHLLVENRGRGAVVGCVGNFTIARPAVWRPSHGRLDLPVGFCPPHRDRTVAPAANPPRWMGIRGPGPAHSRLFDQGQQQVGESPFEPMVARLPFGLRKKLTQTDAGTMRDRLPDSPPLEGLYR